MINETPTINNTTYKNLQDLIYTPTYDIIPTTKNEKRLLALAGIDTNYKITLPETSNG